MKKIFLLLVLCGMLLTMAACKENLLPTKTEQMPTTTQVPMKTIYVVQTEATGMYMDERLRSQNIYDWEYDENGLLQKMTHNSTEYAVKNDIHGRPQQLSCTTKMIDGNEKLITITFSYDKQGNLRSRITACESDVTEAYRYTYDADGNVLTYEHEKQSPQLYERCVSTYENDRLVKEEDYLQTQMIRYRVYAYDDQGRIAGYEIFRPDGTSWGAYAYTYSEDGLTAYINSTTSDTQYRYVKVWDANGNLLREETYITYDGYEESTIVEYTYLAVEIPEQTPRKN